jgi:probable rRNA maturation factor
MVTKPPAAGGCTIRISRQGTAVDVSDAALGKLIRLVAAAEGCRLAEVDLALVGGEEIAVHNRRFMHHSGPTDVLSFDLSDSSRPGLSAQLIVCADVAAKQGPLRGLTAGHELMLYVVHGLLHLMGYEDSTVRGRARMHAREDELLALFGPGPAFHVPPKRKGK